MEGLQPNQKYVFAVAAYNSKAELLGRAIGEKTAPVLASMPVPLLPTWAKLAQVCCTQVKIKVKQRKSRIMCTCSFVCWFFSRWHFKQSSLLLLKRPAVNCGAIILTQTQPLTAHTIDLLQQGEAEITIHTDQIAFCLFLIYYLLLFQFTLLQAAHGNPTALLSSSMSAVPDFRLYWDRDQHSTGIALLLQQHWKICRGAGKKNCSE